MSGRSPELNRGWSSLKIEHLRYCRLCRPNSVTLICWDSLLIWWSAWTCKLFFSLFKVFRGRVWGISICTFRNPAALKRPSAGSFLSRTMCSMRPALSHRHFCVFAHAKHSVSEPGANRGVLHRRLFIWPALHPKPGKERFKELIPWPRMPDSVDIMSSHWKMKTPSPFMHVVMAIVLSNSPQELQWWTASNLPPTREEWRLRMNGGWCFIFCKEWQGPTSEHIFPQLQPGLTWIVILTPSQWILVEMEVHEFGAHATISGLDITMFPALTRALARSCNIQSDRITTTATQKVAGGGPLWNGSPLSGRLIYLRWHQVEWCPPRGLAGLQVAEVGQWSRPLPICEARKLALNCLARQAEQGHVVQ